MLRIGLLGAGMIGNTHINGLLSLKTEFARYTAVCDTDDTRRDTLAQKHNLRAFADLDAMLADPDIDAVDLCLPSFMHEEFAVKIARAKKHLLIEDPEIVSEQSVMQALASVLAAKESLTKGIIII